jgi:hypothetical protein
MQEYDIPKTAFILRNGLYECTMMSFGLTRSSLLCGSDRQGLQGVSGQVHHSVH